ncbi:YceI family protein [Thiomicrorhabdus cannonii]|uniref:YceI family protein n=1 Tax=Thiomicrorhabdus cannonii TaxID=2748011 RepID=UPI001FE2B334|nr:YceI family protein [Thiomicrorhabdus cannonii]
MAINTMKRVAAKQAGTRSNKKVAAALLASALLALSPMVAAAPVNYTIDTQGMHASINFKIQHLGYSWLTGRFEKFGGSYVYDADNVANSKVEVEIDTASINSNHAERDKHLRSADFLNVQKYPQARFESRKVSGSDSEMVIDGQLTLNGVTRDVTITAHKIGEGKDPWGGYRSGFSGATELTLADYGITYNLGPASTKVWLELNIEGVRK